MDLTLVITLSWVSVSFNLVVSQYVSFGLVRVYWDYCHSQWYFFPCLVGVVSKNNCHPYLFFNFWFIKFPLVFLWYSLSLCETVILHQFQSNLVCHLRVQLGVASIWYQSNIVLHHLGWFQFIISEENNLKSYREQLFIKTNRSIRKLFRSHRGSLSMYASNSLDGWIY